MSWSVERVGELWGRPLLGARLLDVGCGDGRFVAACLRAGVEAVGLDPKAPLGDDALIRGHASELPFPDDVFEIVHLYSVFEHLGHPMRALIEADRVLVPGGMLYLHTPSIWSWYEGHKKIPWLPCLWSPWGSRYTWWKLRTMLWLAGFRRVERFCGHDAPRSRVDRWLGISPYWEVRAWTQPLPKIRTFRADTPTRLPSG